MRMTTGHDHMTILALASDANEAVIAYRATDPNHFEAVLCATRRMVAAVDTLTGAIVENINNEGTQ